MGFLVALLVLLILVLLYLLFRQRQAAPLTGPPLAGARLSFVAAPVEAQQGAVNGFQKHGLYSKDGWKTILAPPVKPLEPLLVEHLDEVDPADKYYYLVPFGADDDSVVAVASVNGVSTDYQEATALRKGAWGSIVKKWRDKHQGGSPPLVWRFCVESRDPLYPFAMTATDKRLKYERIDGQLFDKLTDVGPGGGIPGVDDEPPGKSTAD